MTISRVHDNFIDRKVFVYKLLSKHHVGKYNNSKSIIHLINDVMHMRMVVASLLNHYIITCEATISTFSYAKLLFFKPKLWILFWRAYMQKENNTICLIVVGYLFNKVATRHLTTHQHLVHAINPLRSYFIIIIIISPLNLMHCRNTKIFIIC